MNVKKTRLAGALAPAMGLVTVLMSNQAQALPPIPSQQSIRFNFAGWDEGSVGYTASCGGSPVGTPATGAGNAAGCDAVVTIAAKFAQLLNPANSGGPALEDTWGVVRVNSIEANGSTFYSNPVGNGEHISAFFYGLVDGQVQLTATSTATYSYGGILDIWATPAGSADPINGIQAPSSRIDLDSYGTVTDGANTLLLRLAFAPGGDTTVTDSTLAGSFLNSSFGGGSSSLLNVDVLAGAWGSIFDNNGILGTDGNFHDFELDVGFRCGGGAIGVRCQPNNADPSLFTLEVDGSFTGTSSAVPEIDAAAGTGAITLLGGMLALAGERRRRRA